MSNMRRTLMEKVDNMQEEINNISKEVISKKEYKREVIDQRTFKTAEE